MKQTLIRALATSIPEDLPEEIQWMPPGQHNITALNEGKPLNLTVTVTEQTAALLQSSLEKMRADAESGTGDKPYIDFNHEDGAASGHVTAFSWGGDDPIKGGVRAKVEWTEPGKVALQGRAYRRFSPAFNVVAGEIVGAPLNMGGLVNRAAFKTIAPITAKAPPEILEHAFLVKARGIAKERSITEPEATMVLAAAEPGLYGAYRASLVASAEQVNPEEHPFTVKARAAAQAQGITVAQAAVITAGAEPRLYAEYLTNLVNSSNQEQEQGEPEFIVKARSIAKERGITEVQASVALSQEEPALYQSYRESYARK